MDNLWVYLLLIFGYVIYSLLRSARKQREEARRNMPHQESDVVYSEEELRGFDSDILPFSRSEQKSIFHEEEKPLPLRHSNPFLSGEVHEALKPSFEAQQAFLKKIDAAASPVVMPEQVSITMEETPFRPVANEPADDESSPLNGVERPFSSPDELRRAVIASEILNRKY